MSTGVVSFRPMKIVEQQSGSAMIEVCLIVPILILMLLGALDIGLLLRQSMIVAASARVGAEYATTWSTASSSAANLGQMQTYAKFEANVNNNIPNYTVTSTVVCTCGPGGASVSCSGTCAGSVMPAQYAQITASATLPLIFGVSGLPASIPVASSTRMRIAWTGGN